MFDCLEKRTRLQQVAIAMGISALLLGLAIPLNLAHGFLVTEEGSTYLRFARSVNVWRALFAPHQGYYSFIPNLALLFGSRALLWAPLIAVWTGLLVRVAIAGLVASCESFRSGRERIIAAVLTVLIPGAPVAQGTIHSQFYLPIAAAVILISDPATYRLARWAMLSLACLNGPGTAMLAPVFLLRAFREGTRARWSQAILITACACLQVAIVLRSFAITNRAGAKASALWVYVDSLFNHLVILTYCSRLPYHLIARYFVNPHPWAGWCVFVIALASTYVLCRVILFGGTQALTIVICGLITSVGAVLSMRSSDTIIGGGERYFLAANALIGLATLICHRRALASKRSTLAKCCAALIGLSLISGAADVLFYWRVEQSPALQWSAQLSQWSKDQRFLFRNGPKFWIEYTYPLPRKILDREDLPYYGYDSTTLEQYRSE